MVRPCISPIRRRRRSNNTNTIPTLAPCQTLTYFTINKFATLAFPTGVVWIVKGLFGMPFGARRQDLGWSNDWIQRRARLSLRCTCQMPLLASRVVALGVLLRVRVVLCVYTTRTLSKLRPPSLLCTTSFLATIRELTR